MLTGKTIGQYRIGEVIERGGFTEIYRAAAPDGTVVAIKVLHGGFAREPVFQKRFAREVDLLQTLRHENIIPILDYGFSDELTYMVMPYVQGSNLHLVLKQRAFSPQDVLGFVQPIADALYLGHTQGILHRDLKPENILVGRRDDNDNGEAVHYYLADYGVAKRPGIDETLTSAGLAIGTPAYISPEMVLVSGVDARSDIYSLAVMVYELLLGVLPFDMPSTASIIVAHARKAPPPPTQRRADFPLVLEAFLLKNLAKAKQDRHQTMIEFSSAYAQALDTLPPEVRRKIFWTKLPSQRK